MIFSGTLADKVLDGTKTQTRRPVREGKPCQYQAGQDYAVQRKRGTVGLGPRIRVLRVDSVPVFPISFEDAVAEGFESPAAFEARWFELYGNTRPGRCWRIEFVLARSEVTTP